MESFFYQASIYLAATVIAVPFAARLGLGSVLGYLAAGILIGPVFGLVGSETEDLRHFAEFGVVMMLFLIGLELDPRALWNMRHQLLGLGGLQILLTTLGVLAGAIWLGYQWQTGLALGMIFSLSSTAIVLQTLTEKGLMQTAGGRNTFSVLLAQDIAVIPMLILMPLLAIGGLRLNSDGSISRTGETASDHGDHALSLVAGLPGWGATLVTLGAIAAVILTGIYLTRPVFRYIHSARLPEMYTALALLIVVGIAFLMSLVGLSPALGTFLAGVVLGNSEFRHELESDIQPFKGLLLGLFFITVGAGINFAVLAAKPIGILVAVLAIMALKGAVLYLLARLFNIRGHARWLFTLALAQAGEFGFVLISFSLQQGVLAPGLGERLLLIVALSMLFTPLLFLTYEWLSRRMQDHVAPAEPDEIDDQGPVIIAGIGRFGQVVNRLVRSAGYNTVVLDHDIKAIERMRQFGVKGFFGDPTRPDILHAAGLTEAQVLVVALDNPDAALRMVKHARAERPDLHIVARARDRAHVHRLYAAGANDIVRELFDSSLRAGRYVLENVGHSEYEAAQAEQLFYAHDRKTLLELAELWKPDVSMAQNKAYLDRARTLEAELKTALLANLEERDDAGDRP